MRSGTFPLPPYIHGPTRTADRDRYQTVYARARGSVAAPTAGLHLTTAPARGADEQRGVERAEITLHVGYGTFQPVRVGASGGPPGGARVVRDRHEAARPPSPRQSARGAGSIAVGTTTTRALESAGESGDGRVAAGRGGDVCFIYPGFQFRVLGGLLTNFHLPRSSLLMLVCAFAGRERVLAAYREAVARGYRFYSYGDAMLII